MISSEMQLKDYVATHPGELLGEVLLVVNREVAVGNGGFADIIALDSNSNVVIVEAKTDMVTKEALTQALGYASAVHKWETEDLSDMFARYYPQGAVTGENLANAFQRVFGSHLDYQPGDVRLVLLGSGIRSECFSIADYLKGAGNKIDLVTYRADGGTISFSSPEAPGTISNGLGRRLNAPFGHRRRTARFQPETLETFEKLTSLIIQKLPDGAFVKVLPLPDEAEYVYSFWDGTISRGGTLLNKVCVCVKRMKGGLCVRAGGGVQGRGKSEFRRLLLEGLSSDRQHIEQRLGNPILLKDTCHPMEDAHKVFIPITDCERVAERVIAFRELLHPHVISAAETIGWADNA